MYGLRLENAAGMGGSSGLTSETSRNLKESGGGRGKETPAQAVEAGGKLDSEIRK